MPIRLRAPTMSKRTTVLFQVGVGILLFILFIGILNSIVYTSKVPVFTTDDIKTIRIEYFNAITWSNVVVTTYNASAIAARYGGLLYVSIPPPPSGTNALYRIAIPLGIAFNDLISRGVNKIRLYFYIQNTTSMGTSYPAIHISSEQAHVPSSPYALNNFVRVIPIIDDNWNTYYAKYINGSTARWIEIDVNPADVLMRVLYHNWGNQQAWLRFETRGFNAAYAAIAVEAYATSEKPLLKALTEPIYSFFAAVYAVLLAVIKKVKEYVVSAFGGFASQFALTGLIGDPVVALVLTLVFVTILFMVLRPRRR